MVRRSTDEPRTALDRAVAVDKKADEVARALGRGTTALRDSSGNVLQMNPDAPYPLLRPQGVDASVAFDPNTNEIKMVSPDTNEDRDMTVRDISSSGNVYANNLTATGQMLANTFTASGSMYANGDMFAQNFRADGQTTANNLSANSGNFGVLTSGPTQVGTLTSAQINANGDIYGLKLSYLTLENRSDSAVKQRRRKLDRSALAAVAAVEWDLWRYRPEITVDQRDHVGPMADEMATNPLLKVAVTYDDDGNVWGIEQGTLLGILGAAVAEAQPKLDAASRSVTGLRRQQETDRARMDALEQQVADLAEKVTTLEARDSDPGKSEAAP